jgi:hypothetical protein
MSKMPRFYIIYLILILASTEYTIHTTEGGYTHPKTLQEKFESLKSRTTEESLWINTQKNPQRGSRFMISSTGLCLAAGLIPLIFSNQSSPSSRVTGPLTACVAIPIIKYSLLSLGWIGSVLLARLLFPNPSRTILNQQLNRYQNFINPLIKEISEIETGVKQQESCIVKQEETLKSMKEEMDNTKTTFIAMQTENNKLTQEFAQFKVREKQLNEQLITHDKEREQKIERASLQIKIPTNISTSLITLKSRNESFIKELADLTQHEYDVVADQSSNSQPISPSSIMYSRMTKFLQEDNQFLTKLQQQFIVCEPS